MALLVDTTGLGPGMELPGAHLDVRRLCDAHTVGGIEGGVEGYSAHDFRHTGATEWKERGMTLQEVSKILGHTNTAATERCHVEFRQQGIHAARRVMNTL